MLLQKSFTSVLCYERGGGGGTVLEGNVENIHIESLMIIQKKC